MTEVLLIGAAFLFGLFFKKIGLPSLIGYLTAGFALYSIQTHNPSLEISSEMVKTLGHYGVIVLLFTVGLKINFKKLARPEIIGTGVIHFVSSALIFAPVLAFLFAQDIIDGIMLGIILAFSSTVLAAKVLESKSELKSFHGRVAIGILVLQDLIALTVMSISKGTIPSYWSLLVIPSLILLRPVLYKILDWSGHDELLVIAGMVIALCIGGAGFHALNLSGEMGALIMGAIFAKHEKAKELSDKLWSIKEFLLIAFFLSIGMNGLPTVNDWLFAGAAVLLLPIQGLLFFSLLIAFKLTSRSAFLTSTSLTNFSEFGLIVAAVVMPEWTVAIALAVSASFAISAPINRAAHPIFDKFEHKLIKFERDVRHPDEEPVSIGSSEVLIMGMGRVGQNAYRALDKQGKSIVGLDSDQDKIEAAKAKGINCEFADAEHGNLWRDLDLSHLKYCILAMNCTEATKIVALKLREYGFNGYIVAHTKYRDEQEAINEAGADDTYLTYAEAGESLASHVLTHEAEILTEQRI